MAIIGGGIAGVASNAEGESIMVYGDRTDFSEWEFIYDPMKFHVPPNPNSSGPTGIGVPAAQLGSNAGMSSPGTPIGTGPGGTSAPLAAGVGGAGGISVAGFNLNGAAGAAGVSGASGATNPTGAMPTAGSGSPAFGQAGLTDIRPGKK